MLKNRTAPMKTKLVGSSEQVAWSKETARGFKLVSSDTPIYCKLNR